MSFIIGIAIGYIARPYVSPDRIREAAAWCWNRIKSVIGK